MEKYIISDLVIENLCFESGKSYSADGENCFFERTNGRIGISKIKIGSDREAEIYGCRRGTHITVSFPPVWELDANDIRCLSEALAAEIRQVLCELLRRAVNNSGIFVVGGLGNRGITPDSIGPLTAERITVTRHVAKASPNSFESLGVCSVCAVNCGVLGETGVESLELLKGIVREIRPDAVIVVDALATKEGDRIGRAVQISDSGIVPGAGIGNRQSAINQEALGVPVIAIGVPTVVSAATLICHSLQRLGICADEKSIELIKKSTDSYVTLKECDIVCRNLSEILAEAIDRALGVI